MCLYKKEIIDRTKNILNNVSDLKEKAKENKLTVLEKYELNSLIRSLDELSLEQQKNIVYRYFENRTQKQIAEWMLINIKSVN